MESNTNRILRDVCTFTILLMITAAIPAAEKTAEVPFPEGYSSWQHVKSVDATEGGKIYHFYANPQAVEGYRAGKFPDGSVLVRETLRAAGKRTALDVMIKDDRLFGATSGWGFE